MPFTNIINGDCIKEARKLHSFALVFADPPFNIGQDYLVDDSLENRCYEKFTADWFSSALSALGTGSLLIVHGPDALAEQYLMEARVHQLERVAWINWHYKFGQNCTTKFTNAREHCLVFKRSGRSHIFNGHAVKVESVRQKGKDSRAKDGGKIPGNVWGIEDDGPYWSRVQGNSKERHNAYLHPNQLPEVYLARLVKAYTNVGDSVLDMFGGSGTMPVVCNALGRSCTCIEKSRFCCDSIHKRLKKGAVRL